MTESNDFPKDPRLRGGDIGRDVAPLGVRSCGCDYGEAVDDEIVLCTRHWKECTQAAAGGH